MQEQAVGCRVQVYWEGEGEWFEGTVTDYAPNRGYYVQYDDGEEQWEDDIGDVKMRFLSKGSVDNLSTNRNLQKSPSTELAHLSVSPTSEYEEEDANEDDQEDYEKSDKETKLSPNPEQSYRNEEKKADGNAGERALLPKQPRKSTNYVSKNSVFLRDEESLAEMLRDLQAEKKTLTHEYHMLTVQLGEKEQLSVALKREVQELKTQVTLDNLLSHPIKYSRSKTSSSPACTAPKTSTDWKERVLDQKLHNRQLKQDIAELKASVQDKQTAALHSRKQCEQLQEKLRRVPRRDLCTLIDLQVEIAQLMQEKRALEAEQPTVTALSKSNSLAPKDRDNTFSAETSKTALEKQLAQLELAISRAKDDIYQQKLNFERKNAQILPLQARLSALQQELKLYETSQVLLRSVFLQLNPNNEGKVAVNAALRALEMLAPADHPIKTVAVMNKTLQDRSLLADDTTELTFATFVDCFTSLFKSFDE